jgi:hypothetical protein
MNSPVNLNSVLNNLKFTEPDGLSNVAPAPNPMPPSLRPI